ncbi:MAG: 16S rRNA (adenine(1518)-N(6)/adenine(1519)-N(6))-dimethyltransferase RsmA [Synergistaceae bacterium]|jgi:16S rRNA (adenine1518-N6/adenine1519-N6)-dimethyltransferase|nr:16S rRNA (adenine(1518)-N(6)/adenine(1519)-N(6))-dimethyltransferase RsmA [Synergistaceae bacterium]
MAGNLGFFRSNTDIGQNFLKDASVAEWMAGRAGITQSDAVLEIGPGMGILTREILRSQCARLYAIELDVRLERYLAPLAESDDRLVLHWADAVRFNYAGLSPPPAKVIANLPYHITTPVIWALLENLSGGDMRYMLLMTQREAAIRLASGAGSRDSGPLSVTLSALGETKTARNVSRGAFLPMPRVESSIVEIKISNEHAGRAGIPRDRTWRRLLAGSFGQRRKTLVRSWAGAFHIERNECLDILSAHGLPPRSRPEELGVDAWLSLFGDKKMKDFITNA